MTAFVEGVVLGLILGLLLSEVALPWIVDFWTRHVRRRSRDR